MQVDSKLLGSIEVIAREAGAAIMEVYARPDFEVQVKSDDSPLTAADAAAHALIARRLKALMPDLPLLSEEDVAGFAGPGRDGRYWLVDPLDGTKEFIKRNGEFTVNIALIEQGRPVLGVVYAPVLEAMYAAAQGVGAFKQDASGRAPICVSTHRKGAAWRVVGSRSHAGDTLPVILQRLGEHELVSMGSSLKFCLVAEGSADVYPRLGPTSLWDTAAAQCVVEQAGGRVIKLTGEPLGYGDLSAILNPFFIVHGRSDMDWPALFAGDTASTGSGQVSCLAIGIFSRGMRRIPYLEKFLSAPIIPGFFGRFSQPVGTIAGWGYKPASLRARRYAERHALPYLALEDGFLRSVGLGNEPPLSVVVDDLGIYYDATRPSRLESLISRSLSDDELRRIRALIAAWRSGRVSKYNHLRDYAGELPVRYVLVADQTWGDASIQLGQAGPESFQRMLQAALDENPDCTVLVKVHPDVFAGKKRGYFDVPALSAIPRVRVIAENVHPASLIEAAQAIYVVTSQMGFEGLLWGKPVRTFGLPFYAGWGLTQDELPAPQHRGKATLEQLAYAALIAYPRYVNPETGERCEAEAVLEHIALQRQMRERFPPVVYASGFSFYKKPIVRAFLQGSEVRFVRRQEAVPDGGTLMVWGREGRQTNRGIRIIRLEDGFLRSVGLGADLVRPVSWVMDERGIYFDATHPSDLEHLLQHEHFDAVLCRRAARLREHIAAAGLTKYNVGAAHWQRPQSAVRVILVPGQVETDASIAFGAPGIRRNLDLLRTVRAAHPDAYVLYKPHPDVLAGLRAEGQGEQEAQQWCDEIVSEAAMGELLREVDEVHVLTSLVGFEALLRGKPVTCYGQPFYAGWGLTADKIPVARRTRRLSLDELVAGALILYPVYLSRTTHRFTTPEHALDELLAWRSTDGSSLRWWNRAYRLFRSTFMSER